MSEDPRETSPLGKMTEVKESSTATVLSTPTPTVVTTEPPVEKIDKKGLKTKIIKKKPLPPAAIEGFFDDVLRPRRGPRSVVPLNNYPRVLLAPPSKFLTSILQ